MTWFGIIEKHKPSWSARFIQLSAPNRSKAAWWLQFAADKEIAKGETAIAVVEVVDGEPNLTPVFAYMDDTRMQAYWNSNSDAEEPEQTAHIIRLIMRKRSSRALCGKLATKWDGTVYHRPTSDPCAACAAVAAELGLPMNNGELIAEKVN